MPGKQYPLSDQNQPLWEKFAVVRLAEIQAGQMERNGTIDEKAARINLAQYKEGIILLDSLCNDFSQLIPKIVKKAKSIKKSAMINGFLLIVIGNGWLKVSNNVIMEILPDQYQKVVSRMFEN